MLAGIFVGIFLFLQAIYLNPLTGRDSVSPLTLSPHQMLELHFSTALDDNRLVPAQETNGTVLSTPTTVEFSEPTLRDTTVFLTILKDTTDHAAGLGIKMLSKSETTSLIKGAAITNSIWHIYLPASGTIMIDQTENYWAYIRDIVIPAHLASDKSWQGTFHRITTTGPKPQGTANVSGGNGLFENLNTSASESLTVARYLAGTGQVTMDGNLKIVIPANFTTTN